MSRRLFGHIEYIILALSLLSVGSYAHAYVSIQLRPQVKIAQRELKLGDVAAITTTDLSELKWMMSLSIGRFFGTERSLILEKKTLMHWLLRNVPNASGVKWSGPEFVNIVFDMFGDSSKCIDAAQMTLDAWLVKRTVRHEAVVQKSDLRILASQVCRIRPIGEDLSISSRMTIWVDVYDAEGFVRTIALPFKVSAYKEAWVAHKTIAAGTRVLAEQFELRLLDVTGVNELVDVPSHTHCHTVIFNTTLNVIHLDKNHGRPKR